MQAKKNVDVNITARQQANQNARIYSKSRRKLCFKEDDTYG